MMGSSVVPEDRRYLDNRRLGAFLVDQVVVGAVPLFVVIAGGLTPRAGWLLWVVVELTYFFVYEAMTGQTLGKTVMRLRVVRRDGTWAGPLSVAARTLLRLADHSIAGPIAYILSRGSRRRIGDLIGGSIVVDAVHDPGPASRSRFVGLPTYARPISRSGDATSNSAPWTASSRPGTAPRSRRRSRGG